jgi:hypothetical protein
MKTIISNLLLICAALAFAGCSTHSWWLVADQVTTRPAPGLNSAGTNKVFLTEEALPTSAKYQSIGQIDAGKVTTCNTEALLILMADGSRQGGADAVINLKTWRQPCGWSWSAPHGSGELIRLTDTNDLTGLTGYWY